MRLAIYGPHGHRKKDDHTADLFSLMVLLSIPMVNTFLWRVS
jgi:hypothetical protein